MTPSQAAAPPIVARNAGRAAVAISCDQSLKRDASAMPSTVDSASAFGRRYLNLALRDATSFGNGVGIKMRIWAEAPVPYSRRGCG